MAGNKKNTAFFCQECGFESAKWTGQCPSCKAWNTMVEEPVRISSSRQGAGRAKGISASRNTGFALGGNSRVFHPVPLSSVEEAEEVRFSITHNRGCFGYCNFCSIALHQGRRVTCRSEESVLAEAERITKMPDFKGYIHDVGGPTADFRHPSCDKQLSKGLCMGKKCLAPKPGPALKVDHTEYLAMLRKLRKIKGVKRVFIRSGRFYEITKGMGKEQYLVPYLMSSHPGSTLNEAIDLALFLRDNKIRPEQVQDFYPTPGTISTAMFYTELDPYTMEKVYVPKTPKEKAMQRALLQYFRPQNREIVLEALKKAGRRDLIGTSPNCLVQDDRKPAPNQKNKHVRNDRDRVKNKANVHQRGRNVTQKKKTVGGRKG